MILKLWGKALGCGEASCSALCTESQHSALLQVHLPATLAVREAGRGNRSDGCTSVFVAEVRSHKNL